MSELKNSRSLRGLILVAIILAGLMLVGPVAASSSSSSSSSGRAATSGAGETTFGGSSYAGAWTPLDNGWYQINFRNSPSAVRYVTIQQLHPPSGIGDDYVGFGISRYSEEQTDSLPKVVKQLLEEGVVEVPRQCVGNERYDASGRPCVFTCPPGYYCDVSNENEYACVPAQYGQFTYFTTMDFRNTGDLP